MDNERAELGLPGVESEASAMDPLEWASEMALALSGMGSGQRAAADAALAQWSDFVGLFFGVAPTGSRRGPAGSFESLASSKSSLRRKALLYRPDSAPPGAPLVVMLHGCKQSALDFERLTGMSRLAERDGFCVLYPDQDSSANPMHCWNWHDPANQRRAGGEPEALAELIEIAAQKAQTTPARTHIAGISAGGALASLMAHLYPERLGSCAIVAGPLPFGSHGVIAALRSMKNGPSDQGASDRAPCSPRARLPMLIIHGQDDEVVNPKHGLSQAQAALALNQTLGSAEAGRAPESHESKASSPGGEARVWRDERGALVAVLVSPKELRHAWSGGEASERFAQRGFSASQLALNFFSAAEKGEAKEFEPERLCDSLWGPAFQAQVERAAQRLRSERQAAIEPARLESEPQKALVAMGR